MQPGLKGLLSHDFLQLTQTHDHRLGVLIVERCTLLRTKQGAPCGYINLHNRVEMHSLSFHIPLLRVKECETCHTILEILISNSCAARSGGLLSGFIKQPWRCLEALKMHQL